MYFWHEREEEMVILVIGGSGSGKSDYAEKRAAALACTQRKRAAGLTGAFSREGSITENAAAGRLLYIATMEPYDEESYKRIERHRQMRKERNFITIECYTHLEKLKLYPEDTVLLECVSNLTANEMYSREGRGEQAAEWIIRDLIRLAEKTENLVIVGNNVFEDGITYDDSTMEYLRQMALIQREAARLADEVVEIVAGIPCVMRK